MCIRDRLGLILAIFLSRILTRPVSNLCHEIDILDPSDGTQIDLKSCGSNQELRKLIDSFNGMSQRLFLSLKQNYEIQITEQQMRVQMLQFQINHHFLHNTLNVIKSLAEIHDVPEVETIATCMSELVRYNPVSYTHLSFSFRNYVQMIPYSNLNIPFACSNSQTAVSYTHLGKILHSSRM